MHNQDNQSERARELLAQHRQHDALRQDAMLERTEEELNASSQASVEAEARSNMANQRHQENHTKDSMLERSEEELDQG